MRTPLHRAVDVLQPLADRWLADNPEHRRCLRCGCPRFAHVDHGCLGSVYEPCRVRCAQHVDSWANTYPSKHQHPKGEQWR